MSTANQTPAPAAASDKLEQLFSGLYGASRSDVPLAFDADVMAVLASIDPGQSEPVAAVRRGLGGAALSNRQLGVIRLAQSVLSDYFSQPVFHPTLAQQLLASSGRLLAEALPLDGWLLSRSHAVHGLLDQLADFARGWCPQMPQAEAHAGEMCGWLADEAAASQRLQAAQAWLADFARRQERLAERVVASEAGTLRAQYVAQTAARLMNRQLAGRALPDFIAADIEQHWLAAFHWTLLNKGERSPEWHKLSRGFGLLVWALQPDAKEENQRNKLSRVAEQLRSELFPLLDQVIADQAGREGVKERIDVALLCQLHDRPIEYRQPAAVAGGSALDQAGAEISEDLLAEISAIHVGDWFVEADSEARLRLLVKLDEFQQLLFVNQLGIKQFSASFEEFAWQFSSARISTVVAALPLAEWVAEQLGRLSEQYRARKRARQEDAVERERQLLAELEQQEARERARRKALLEAGELERASKQNEALSQESLADEAAAEQARRQAAAVNHGDSETQRQQRSRLLVSSLTMGAWLSFHDELGKALRRKLAVILPSSGKYIFVALGDTDKLEITRQELIDGIASGSIEVTRKDSRFDDALNRVVGGMQRGRVDG